MSQVQPEQEKPVKLKSNDPAYFREYYHRHNGYVMCECGATVTASYQKRHSKQPKHLRLITAKNLLANQSSEIDLIPTSSVMIDNPMLNPN